MRQNKSRPALPIAGRPHRPMESVSGTIKRTVACGMYIFLTKQIDNKLFTLFGCSCLAGLQLSQEMNLNMHRQQKLGVAGMERIGGVGVVLEWGRVLYYEANHTGGLWNDILVGLLLLGRLRQNTHLGRFCRLGIIWQALHTLGKVLPARYKLLGRTRFWEGSAG